MPARFSPITRKSHVMVIADIRNATLRRVTLVILALAFFVFLIIATPVAFAFDVVSAIVGAVKSFVFIVQVMFDDIAAEW